MKKYILIIFILTATSVSAQLKLKPYSDSLVGNASSLIREDFTEVTIKSPGSAVETHRKVVTVFNESGKDELSFREFTDKFHSLQDVKIVVYNKDGIVQKTYSRKDLAIFNYDNNVVGDGKQYTLTIAATSYPVHISFDYQINYNGVLHLPVYQVRYVGQPVLESSLTVKVPAKLGIRYKMVNTDLTPSVTNEKDNIIYHWSAANQEALKIEVRSAPFKSVPLVLIAPNRFELDGYDGDMSSWESFGRWYGELSKKALDLTSERKVFMQQLVKDLDNDREKTAAIYNYLQKNFRYVSIQLGIGGWKPFPASFVDQKQYGDCKALSNYTQACLDAAGVKSHQALIFSAGTGSLVSQDFPVNMFNHVVLAVPLEKDTVWLECTSNTNEFGVLGVSTENRNALLITGDGGKLVATPVSDGHHNKVMVNTIVKLNTDGSGTANVQLVTRGNYRMHEFAQTSKDDKLKYLSMGLGLEKPDDFELQESINPEPGLQSMNAKMTYSKIPAIKAGSKMFLHPRFYSLWNRDLPAVKERKQDFYLDFPFHKDDTTTYILPENYFVEKLPAKFETSSKVGTYKVEYFYDESSNQLKTISQLKLNHHIIPAASYHDTKKFFDAITGEFASKIVITRKS